MDESDKKNSDGGLSTSLATLIQEPLSLASLAVFFLTWFRLFLTKSALYSIMPLVCFVLGLLSCYFTYLYFKGKEKRYPLLGIPLLIFVVALFLYYSGLYTGSSLERDYAVFSVMASIYLLFYTLAVQRVMRMESAMVVSLFFSTLILHVITAYSPYDYVGHLDPHYYYKIADVTYRTGFVPEHDYMLYPLPLGIQGNTPDLEPGLDYSRSSFFATTYMAYAGTINRIFGLTLREAAILYPALVSAFTVVALYLLVSELFSESVPYNRIAGFIAAFMMMVSPAYASNSTAINCEDDAFGMFLVVASLMLFAAAFKRRNMSYVYLAGLSIFMLRVGWGGYIYVPIVLGLFSVLYSIAKFLRNEPCFDHVTYIFASNFPSFFTALITHARGKLPNLVDFPPFNADIVALAGAFVVGITLEYMRFVMHSRDKTTSQVSSGNVLDRVNAWIEREPKILFSLAIVLTAAGLFYFGFDEMEGVVKAVIESRKQDDVIRKTISEQNPFAASLSEYLSAGSNRFSILFLYSFITIPVLLYLGFRKADFGSLFLLSWGLPMLWGVYFKSQYIFTASAPIVALGSTVGLYSIAKKKDFEGLRVVGLMLVLVIPFVTIPFLGSRNYGEFIAMVPMYMGPTSDRIYWQSTLVWLRDNTKRNAAVLTWWDYGHWITSEAYRAVLIDNLQADGYQIQDVARFFVNKTTEEDAMEIFSAYEKKFHEVRNVFPEGVDLRYVAIDWTMIGKGSALHFIATGDIKTKADGSFKNYAICGFVSEYSDKTQRVMSDEKGNMFLGRKIIFACNMYIPGIEFTVKEDKELVGVNVIMSYGQKVPWKRWVEQNDASILGVQPLYQILSLAIEKPDERILEQYRAIIYVPGEFSDFMMTRLYLLDHLKTVFDEKFCAKEENKNNIGCVSYMSAGLYNREYEPLKHFKLIKDFENGYVRLYEKTE